MSVFASIVAWLSANAELVKVILGLFTPIIVGAIATCKWPGWAKGYLALAVALGIGFITAAMQGSVDLANLGTSFVIVLGTAQAFYLGVLKPKGLDVWLLEHLGLT